MEKRGLAWQCLMTAEPSILSSSKSMQRFFTYALIGVLTNVLGYAIYLYLTCLWDAPKLTMTALYFVGVSTGFLVNRRFTFQHDASIGVTGVRYLLVEVVGYLINLVLIVLFVDWLGSHIKSHKQ